MMNKEMKYLFCAFGFLFLFSFYNQLTRMYKISKCGKYTIGVFDRFATQSRSLHVVYYSYKVNGISYNESIKRNDDFLDNYKMVYLRFACDNPEIIEGIWDKKVDSLHLKDLPAEGWDKLPD